MVVDIGGRCWVVSDALGCRLRDKRFWRKEVENVEKATKRIS
jgi:hypothetical protein